MSIAVRCAPACPLLAPVDTREERFKGNAGQGEVPMSLALHIFVDCCVCGRVYAQATYWMYIE